MSTTATSQPRGARMDWCHASRWLPRDRRQRPEAHATPMIQAGRLVAVSARKHFLLLLPTACRQILCSFLDNYWSRMDVFSAAINFQSKSNHVQFFSNRFWCTENIGQLRIGKTVSTKFWNNEGNTESCWWLNFWGICWGTSLVLSAGVWDDRGRARAGHVPGLRQGAVRGQVRLLRHRRQERGAQDRRPRHRRVPWPEPAGGDLHPRPTDHERYAAS